MLRVVAEENDSIMLSASVIISNRGQSINEEMKPIGSNDILDLHLYNYLLSIIISWKYLKQFGPISID